MKNSTKKWLTVTGCLAICAVLVGLIGTRMANEPPLDKPLPSQSSQPSDVTVTPPDAEKEKDVVVTPPEIPATSQPTGSLPPQTDLPEQKIQPDPVKPEYTEDQLKDQTQTPDGKPVTTPPPAVDHDKVEQPKEPPESSNEPQGGDTNNGQIYVPGFGWIEDEGGGGQGTVGESDGDINKQVGTM